MKILTQKFFERPTLTVAKNLLGKYLVRKYKSKIVRVTITETEAYDGPNDKASHASRGMTERNKVMFGPAGVWYAYFTYGMHWMLNIVTGKRGYPAAILIRAVQPIEIGSQYIEVQPQYIKGPARVTKFLKIGKKFNNKKAIPKNGLWLEDPGVKIPPRQIRRSARVGVAYAGPKWSRRRYRFFFVQGG